MTCVAGIAHEGKVYLGADSAGIGGWDLTLYAAAKVFVNGPFVMGFTTSFRMGQLLRYVFVPPDHDPAGDVDKFMATVFIDAVRRCLKDGGFAKKEREQEEGGCFLVGHQGRLFVVHEDYQIGRPARSFAAVGCGAQAALGALCVLNPSGPKGPLGCLELALSAAERLSAGVRGPFAFVEG